MHKGILIVDVQGQQADLMFSCQLFLYIVDTYASSCSDSRYTGELFHPLFYALGSSAGPHWSKQEEPKTSGMCDTYLKSLVKS